MPCALTIKNIIQV